jgi:lipopolysaccharide export LptBFGC system permease protein LptF
MTYLNSSLGTYYKFVVNNVAGTTSGEGQQIWQSNSASTTVYIYILTPSTPYEWNAYYNQAQNNVTVVYSDSITPSSVIVTITDLKTNLQVVSQTYTATPSFTYNYHDPTGMGSYQVNIVINRLSSQTRDQRMITSAKTFGITMPVDIYIVYALSTLFLMILAGLFSYANARRGGFAVVIVAVVLMYFGLLPWGMITVAMLAAIFAVMSLFSSRVQ